MSQFDQWRQQGAIVLDCRSPEAFSSHVPGAVNVGLGSSFATWSGSVLPPDTPLILVLERPQDLWEVCWQLLRIGYDLPQGWLAGGMMAWRVAAKELALLTQWTVHTLREQQQRNTDLLTLDVRQIGEWNAGYIKDAVHITGAELPQRLDEVPKDRPVAVMCGSGYRASVAASLLQQQDRAEVINVLGGMNAWESVGFEVV